jgi:hypothetical protein
MEFNKSATTFISYSATVTPTDDAMKQNLDNELDRTTYKDESNGLSFSQVLRFKLRFLKGIKYTGVVRHALNSNSDKLGLNANQELFDLGTVASAKKQKQEQ